MEKKSEVEEEKIVLDLSIVKEEYCIQEEDPIEFNDAFEPQQDDPQSQSTSQTTEAERNGPTLSQDTSTHATNWKTTKADSNFVASQSRDTSEPLPLLKIFKTEPYDDDDDVASDNTFVFAHMLEALIPIAESILHQEQEEYMKKLALGPNAQNYDKVCLGKMKIEQEEEEEEVYLDLSIVKEEECVQEYSASIDIEAFPKSPQRELGLEAFVPNTEPSDCPEEEHVPLRTELNTAETQIAEGAERCESDQENDDRTFDDTTFDDATFNENPEVPENPPPAESHPLFLCQFCGACYAKPRLLRRHTKNCRKLHKRNKPDYFECATCGKKFRQKSHLADHVIIHVKNRPTQKCEFCEKSYKIGSSLRGHRLICKSKMYRAAPSSRIMSMRARKLAKDVEEQTQSSDPGAVKQKRRNNVQKQTQSSESEQMQLNFSLEELPKSVSNLPETVVTESSETQNEKERDNFECRSCGKKFRYEQTWWEHEVTHLEDRPYVPCEICGEGFLIGTPYRIHLTKCKATQRRKGIPRNAEPVQKKELDDVQELQEGNYSLSEYLRRTETEESEPRESEEAKPSEPEELQSAEMPRVPNIKKCSMCGKRFKSVQCVLEHELIHMENRPSVTCQKCGKCLLIGAGFRRHVLSCVGEFDYRSLIHIVEPKYQDILNKLQDIIEQRANLSKSTKSNESEAPQSTEYEEQQSIEEEQVQPTEHEALQPMEEEQQPIHYNESQIKVLRELGRGFKCRTCGSMFKSRQSWIEHELIHLKNRPSIACKNCDKKILFGTSLRKHWQQCVGTFDYAVFARNLGPEYEEMFRYFLSSKPFISANSNSDPPEPPTSTESEKPQITEYISIGNVRKCRTCDKPYRSVQTLREHELTHLKNRPRVPCKYCGAYYLLGGSLRIHMQQCIGRQGRQRKDLVQKGDLETVEKSQLKEENSSLGFDSGNISQPDFVKEDYNPTEFATEEPKSIESQNDPIFKCSTCDKVFLLKRTLVEHEIIHIQNRPRIPCKKCGVMYLMGSSLRTHQQKCFRSRTGKVLSRNLRRAQEKKMAEHQMDEKTIPNLTETSQKDFEKVIKPELEEDLICTTCGKRFKTKQSWKEHSFIHLENRPRVRCAKCGMSALLGSPFRLHVQKCYGKDQFWKRPKNISSAQKRSTRNLLSKFEEVNGDEPDDSMEAVHEKTPPETVEDPPEESFDPPDLPEVPEVTSEPKKKIFQCSYCWKVCYRKDNLAHHIVTHLKHRSYITCKLCGTELLESSMWSHRMRCNENSRLPYKPKRARRPRIKKRFGSPKRIQKTVATKRRQNLIPAKSASAFTCDNCGRHFKLKHFLRVHRRTCGQTQIVPREDPVPEEQPSEQMEQMEQIEERGKKHKCSTCGKAFNRRQAWKEHEITHLKTRPLLKCGKCGVSYLMGSPFRKHFAKCTGRPKRGTPSLKFNGSRKDLQDKRQKTIKSPTKKMSKRSKEAILIEKGFNYKCSICGKRYKGRTDCSEHELTHLQNRPLCKCDKCGVSYFMGSYFRRHQRLCDGQPRRGTVLATPEGKRSENNAVEHPKTSRTVPQPVQKKSDSTNEKRKKLIIKCATCGKRFNHIQKLKDHEVIHLKNRPLAKCHKCGVSYFVGSYQRMHVRKCNGEPRRGTDPKRIAQLKVKTDVKDQPKSSSSRGRVVRKQAQENKVSQSKIVRKQVKKVKSNRKPRNYIHKCATCGRSFDRPQLLKDHEFLHMKNRPMKKCDKCGVKYLMGIYLRKHMQKCTGQPLRGTPLAKVEKKKKAIQENSKSRSPPKRVQSPRKEPERKSQNNMMYKCSTCGKSFRQLLQYTEHKLVHLKDRPLAECPSCGVSYLMGSSFRRHISQCNGSPMRGTPQKKLDEQSNGSTLNEHQTTISRPIVPVREPERAFKCAICDKIFQQKENLTAHMNTHVHLQNTSLIPCEHCGIPYLESYLRMHRKICQGPTEILAPLPQTEAPVTEKPQEAKKTTPKFSSRKYECPVCFKIFGHKGSLQNHMSVHRDRRPDISCEKCGTSFTMLQSLRRHQKKNTCQYQKNKVSATYTSQVTNDARKEQ
ncbi:zinc finger protein Xfin-like [Phlebotomus papatasi]|uniref:zinc finger protein Xfin-like n=1 Tax=Phlebotomus papatasi TaxID=29031 RepID=UPI002483BF0E|nr:zinc finger protein Xfin-like [Phlebotomus papatasi]